MGNEICPIENDMKYPLAVFRIWRIASGPFGISRLSLKSMVQGTVWGVTDQKSSCLCYQHIITKIIPGGRALSNPPHQPPGISCMCGFYGYSDFDAAKSEYEERQDLPFHQRSGDALVLGAALFWGATVVGRVKDKPGLRYRSRIARVLGFLDNPLDERIKRFAIEHNLAIVSDERYLRAIAQEHGQLVCKTDW